MVCMRDLPIFAQVTDFAPQPGEKAPTAPGTVAPGGGITTGSIPEEPSPRLSKIPQLSSARKLILPIIAIVIVAALVIFATKFIKISSNTTTTAVTTTINSNLVGSCRSINSPGTYSFSGNITTGISSGPCINVTADGVQLDCNGHGVTGSGPYSGVGPFTYGIKVAGNDIGITDCAVMNFSYGIFTAPGSSGITINRNRISDNYISNLYMNGTGSSSVYSNMFTGSVGRPGSVYITNGSTDDSFYNNTVLGAAYIGINISSTGNSFHNNYINRTPVSFSCSPYGGIRENNKGFANNCQVNSGCAFLECEFNNTPPNLAGVTLSNQVSGCGAVNFPGVYNLSGPINMALYVNPAYSKNEACINIRTRNVTLNCNGYAISNATIGIAASQVDGISVKGCVINATNYGLDFENVSLSEVSNTRISGGAAGVLLGNSHQDNLKNITVAGSNKGIFLSNSTTDTINRFSVVNNSYGLYLSNSTGNIFDGGVAKNNLVLDVYATNNSAKANYNLMTTTSCGFTNAVWAPCVNHVSLSIGYYPINSCTTIMKPGNYSLQLDLAASTQVCINVRSSNVSLKCNGHQISASILPSTGSSIAINGVTNVTVTGCRISGYGVGVNATNSSDIGVSNSSFSSEDYGVSFNRVNGSSIVKDSVSATTYYGIGLLNSNDNLVAYNNFTSASSSSSASLLLNSSRDNVVASNRGYHGYVGMSLQGSSINNTVMNNTMSGSSTLDYVCSTQSSGLGSEYGGINYGASGSGCHWLAVLTPLSNLHCAATFASNRFTLTTGNQYTAGTTCFNVYGNSTILNCQGATILANHGGALMSAKNAQATVENCYVKGFDTVLSGTNSTLKLLNDTILLNSTSAPYQAALNLTKSGYVYAQYDNITSPQYGILVSGAEGGSLLDDDVFAGSVAYSVVNSTDLSITNNNAQPGSGIGFILNGSSSIKVQNNNFSGILFGVECLGAMSQSPYYTTDLGGNSCTSQYKCGWISSSSSTCH